MLPKPPRGSSAQHDQARTDEERIAAGKQVRCELTEAVHGDMISFAMGKSADLDRLGR